LFKLSDLAFRFGKLIGEICNLAGKSAHRDSSQRTVIFLWLLDRVSEPGETVEIVEFFLTSDGDEVVVVPWAKVNP
jgi:hypothetical protein